MQICISFNDCYAHQVATPKYLSSDVSFQLDNGRLIYIETDSLLTDILLLGPIIIFQVTHANMQLLVC